MEDRTVCNFKGKRRLIILQFPNPRGREVDEDVTHVTEYGHFLESSSVKIWVQLPEALSKKGDDVMCYLVCVILHGINITHMLIHYTNT